MPVVMDTMRSNNGDAFGVGQIDKRAAYLHIVRRAPTAPAYTRRVDQ